MSIIILTQCRRSRVCIHMLTKLPCLLILSLSAIHAVFCLIFSEILNIDVCWLFYVYHLFHASINCKQLAITSDFWY